LPPQITLNQARAGVSEDTILFTPATAKDMIEIHAPELPPEITDFQVLSNTSGNSTCHIDVIYATIFVVTVSHLNYLLCAVYKFTKTLGSKEGRSGSKETQDNYICGFADCNYYIF
jgi:hypothetical protein